jgi:glutaconate CoA-transferase subunit B
VVTPLAVFVKRNDRLALGSWHPESSLEEVQRRTGFKFDATEAGPTPWPTEREKRALAELDSEGRFERDANISLR